MKRIFLCILLACAFSNTYAQEDLLSQLDSTEKPQHEPVTATFKATRLINFHTLETVGKRTLDFRIAHRFADASQGINNFYGLDGPASIKLSLEYSYDGRLMAGIGRTNIDKLVDGFLKYKLIRQTEDNHIPLTVTLFTGMYVNATKEPPAGLHPRYQYFSNRLSYCYQVMIGRKFNERLSLQVAPTMIHYNIVENALDKNDMFAVVALGRYKFTRRTAITAEYAYRIGKYDYSTDPNDKNYNSFGLGFDIETGGHVFQIHFTNSSPIDEVQTIPYTKHDWLKREFRLGFNISRVFAL